jgi:hypothetical protein
MSLDLTRLLAVVLPRVFVAGDPREPARVSAPDHTRVSAPDHPRVSAA